MFDDRTPPKGFTHETMARGRTYALRGQVTSIALAEDGMILTASVIGTAPLPYDVRISARRGSWAAPFDGVCTCPMARNCKHVAATLLVATRPEMRKHLAMTYPVVPKTIEGLSPTLQIWMNDLRVAQAGADEEYPTDVRQRLFYVFKPLQSRNPQIRDIGVEVVSARLLKDGSLSDGVTTYPIHTLDNRGAGGTKFLRPSDREILPSLARLAQRGSPAGRAVRLAGVEGTTLMRAILATGRCHWEAVTGPALEQGEPVTAGIIWVLNQDGSQSPTLDVRADCIAVRMAPPWCIAPEIGQASTVRTGLGDRLADTMLGAPPVPPEQAQALRDRLERDVPVMALHAPPVLAAPEHLAVPMVPVLRIEARRQTTTAWTSKYRDFQPITTTTIIARLLFCYDTFELPARDDRPLPRFTIGRSIVEIVRDGAAEAAAMQTLNGLGFVAPRPGYRQGPEADELTLASQIHDAGPKWLDFFYYDAPRLRDQGWSIVIADDVPIRLVTGTDIAFAADLHENEHGDSGKIDWFEFDLGVIIDGERIDLLPALVDLITNKSAAAALLLDVEPDDDLAAPIFLPLPDGRTVAIPHGRLIPIVRVIYELLAAKSPDEDGKIRLSAYDAGFLTGLDQDLNWSGGEPLRRLGRLLGETGSIPQARIPVGFAASLRPYQAQGVDWLQFLRKGGLAGILADEMGLGKTVQALAHVLIEQTEGRLTTPALIIAPTSLVVNWLREAERFAPTLRVLVLHGPDRADRFSRIPEHDLVITTYSLLGRDHAVLHEQNWHMVVLDEAQVIKNPNAQTSRLMRGLKTEHRLCLTGTPLENNLGELWSLFAFLAPALFGDRKNFQKRWRNPIEKQGDTERQAMLARYVRPFLLRRTKALVAAELPPKTEIAESIGMDAAQRNLYEGIRLAMHSKVREAIAVKGLARSHIVILEALLRLRQTCCDPRLLKLPAKTKDVASAKLERLGEMVPELVADGRRILIFSQFTSMLALIETMLNEAKLPWVKLTGDTRDRQTPIARFQAGEVPIFLISLKAGGVGINLTAADTVIHYDPWWNPAVEDQATDRAHRIGQPNPVFVHRLVVADSVEEKMESLKLRKRQLAEGLFDNAAGDTLAFSEADIDDLFA